METTLQFQVCAWTKNGEVDSLRFPHGSTKKSWGESYACVAQLRWCFLKITPTMEQRCRSRVCKMESNMLLNWHLNIHIFPSCWILSSAFHWGSSAIITCVKGICGYPKSSCKVTSLGETSTRSLSKGWLESSHRWKGNTYATMELSRNWELVIDLRIIVS
jgi:hypothetical protein